MFETLFGAEMPLTVRFFLAFVIVLGLIGAAAWAVRRFGSGRYGAAGQRGRQPRLAVIDHASVDARRRLVLIRRDNVEHLLLIGGPTDLVVEPNIVRAAPAAREVPAARTPAAADLLSRAIALPDTGSSDSWPLQPEPTAPPPPRRAPRTEPMPDEPAITAVRQHAEAPRPQRETLTALADNLAPHPATPSRTRTAAAARSPTVEPRISLRASAEAPSAVDQGLAEMAQKLEAALRKPKAADAREAAVPPVAPRAAFIPEPSAQAEASAPPSTSSPPPSAVRAARAAEAKPVPSDAPAKEGKALYDSLEQEMASLLGRPPSKT
ncbi:MAG TPA: flagellar biosynthetic protein FliO [Xanthobacteraceae bacterium]|nr:flagellar biosynthetic protein FliO [Xanthobacteraceae bacterium]